MLLPPGHDRRRSASGSANSSNFIAATAITKNSEDSSISRFRLSQRAINLNRTRSPNPVTIDRLSSRALVETDRILAANFQQPGEKERITRVIFRAIALVAILIVSCPLWGHAETSGSSTTVGASTEPRSAARPLKPINKRFLLSHNSSVYREPNTSSAVVAHVKRGRHVRVVGITGDWLQIRLSGDKVGFIPTKAAE